jgi:AraC family transcriptional regulator
MSVTVILAGTLRERVGPVEETAGPLSLVIKPVDVEHENHFGPGPVRTVQLTLAGGEAAALGEANPALRAWRWIHGGPAVRGFLALARALPSELAAVDALAGITPASALSGDPPPALRAVRERLEEESDPPSIRELAREAGMHPVYLARLFRRAYGITMSEYRRRRRVARAIAGLETATLSHTAHAAGFADHPHMCRAFRAETGLAPSAYRLLLA